MVHRHEIDHPGTDDVMLPFHVYIHASVLDHNKARNEYVFVLEALRLLEVGKRISKEFAGDVYQCVFKVDLVRQHRMDSADVIRPGIIENVFLHCRFSRYIR
jgi:hypothetical protein